MKIIVISGRKQSGKDSIGDFILRNREELFGIGTVGRKYGFGDVLKEILSSLFGISEDLLYGGELEKSQPTHICWKDLPHWSNKCPPLQSNKLLTVRELLQQFGTQIIRRMDSNAWVRSLENKIKAIKNDVDLVVVTDARFPNEILAAKSWGARVIRLTRGEGLPQNHESEWVLDKHHFDRSSFDAVIDNQNLSLEDQNKEMIRILREWNWTMGEQK